MVTATSGVMVWTQVYDPLHSWLLSRLVAALPILVLFGLLAGLKLPPHWCAVAAATAVLVAVTVLLGRRRDGQRWWTHSPSASRPRPPTDRKSTRLNSSH